MSVTLVKNAVKSRTCSAKMINIPDISKREYWDKIPADLKEKLVKAGEESLQKQWSVILITDRLEFARTGNRVHYEDKSFSRRQMLCDLVMAELIENKGRFTDKILEGIFLMLEEISWCHPAHDIGVPKGYAEAIADTKEPVIDLFAAETGADIALAEYLMRPVFNKMSPFISENINESLRKRIIDPYLSRFFWWMGDGRSKLINWTVWIIQNIFLTVFTRPEGIISTNETQEIISKSADSIDQFISGYGEDGCCDEGAQYYGHAGLCLWGCLWLLNDAGYDMSPVFNEPIIKNIGNYIVKMYIGNNLYINYADCSPLAGLRSARDYLFGKACSDTSLSSFAANDYRNQTWEEKLQRSENNLWYHVLMALNHKEMLEYPVQNIPPQDTWFESTGTMIARDDTYTFAAKAGNNADSHNHNDTGSITLYKSKAPLLIDLGVQTYTKKTFSDKRYELFAMQSQYHNLPTFHESKASIAIKENLEKEAESASKREQSGIIMELDGSEYKATEVSCILGDNDSSLEMNIAKAFDDERIKSYKRAATLFKGSHVEIHDVYEGSLSCTLSFISYEKPEIISAGADNGKAVKIMIGDLGVMDIFGCNTPLIETIPINDKRLAIMWKHNCYRILIPMSDKEIRVEIR